jgi:two-component system CheB/CheR fusion protein
VGSYPPTIAAEVSPERLDRFFTLRPGAFAVRPEIRQMVIFARHNLIADPPFTRMDLVSCRNALIYLQPAAQERALRGLQFALRLDAHLLLGPSESLGPMQQEFAVVASRHKIYRLLQRNRVGGVGDPLALPRGRARKAAADAPSISEAHARRVEAGRQQVMRAYAPPTLLVGPGRELLHVYGDATALLKIGDGSATLDVVKLLPRELAWAAGLLLQAPQDGSAVQRSAPLRLPPPPDQPDAPERMVVIAAQRLGQGEENGLVLLSFEPATGTNPLAPDEVVQGIAQQRITQALELELERTRESLQATIEELEASNEELQATNEEMMASNEELQSTNEELQSVNEELYTVNAEYQEKVDLLNSVNADLENVSKAAAIPTLFVDDALRLTRITPEAALLFKVREVDLGRSIEDFTHLLDYPSLFADLRRTVDSGLACEFEVRSRTGDWWLARLHPYAGRSASQSRAVMTFFNITSVKDSQRLQAIIDSLPEHVAVLDLQGTIQLVNQAWRRYAHDHGDTELRASGPGSSYLRVCAEAALHDDDARRAHEGLTRILEGRQETFTMRYPCHSRDQHRWFQMHVGRVAHGAGGVVVSHVDVSDWAADAAAGGAGA